MTTAALGGQIEVPTLEGATTRVKVPEGTESGKQFRLKGKGMPVLRQPNVGDLYIQVSVETPQSLTKRQRELLVELTRGHDSLDSLDWDAVDAVVRERLAPLPADA